jgi:hypothetical protein
MPELLRQDVLSIYEHYQDQPIHEDLLADLLGGSYARLDELVECGFLVEAGNDPVHTGSPLYALTQEGRSIAARTLNPAP